VQEVRRHVGIFAAAAERVRATSPAVQPVIAAGSAVPAGLYDGMPFPTTLDGDTLLHHAQAALVKSGTSTLQAALAATPLVVTYRVHPLTWFLAQRLVDVPHVGLVNLVAGERIAPELLQDEATPERLAAALLPLLSEGSTERQRALEGLERVRTALAPPAGARSAAEQVAELAAELVR
jgi:lipid-A-disaccharide synthase